MTFNIQKLLAGTIALVLVIGITSPAFAVDELVSVIGPPGIAGSPEQNQISQDCAVIDFEGVGDLLPVAIIGDTTWGGAATGLVDSDAGGSGNFANEPSPDTIAFVPGSGIMDVTLTNPASQVSWFYFADADETVRIYDIDDVLIATVTQTSLPQGIIGGDPTSPV